MVAAYRETPEDRALTNAYRTYRGRKIDIRWRGGWLTPTGTFHLVDYKNGVTHETLAEKHGSHIIGSGSISTRPPIMRIFDCAMWMRITYLEYSLFCVELKGAFIGNCSYASGLDEEALYVYNRRRQRTMLQFVQDYANFECYLINNVQYASFREFVAAIRANDVTPTEPLAEEAGSGD